MPSRRSLRLGVQVLSIEERHVALPKLYGAPAYARPPRIVEESPRPLNPDDLPIAAFQTDEEREIAASLPDRPYVDGEAANNGTSPPVELSGRPFRLRALAGKLLRGS